MKILYLDTSSSFLYCAIVKNDECIGELKLNLQKDLSSLALSQISNLFVTTSTDPKDIDKILVVNGPGSFTGIRVGLTIAKTYAWSLSKKISTISSLEAMAISSKGESDYFIPVIDARRGYVYSGIYDKVGNSILKDQYINLETLKITVNNLPGRYVFITNDKMNDLAPVEGYVPDFVSIVNKYQDKEELNPHEIDALYLKLTEAEEKQNA
jgi:tRNA threonylcarbamoyladenosine biosynthesis protein TsaB